MSDEYYVEPEGTRMKDVASPFFSTMIIDYLDNLSTSEQVRIMKLLGVPGDRREAYLEVLESAKSSEVVVKAIEAPPVEDIEITPTMAIKGLPGTKGRPMPQVGSGLLSHPTIDLTQQKKGLPPAPQKRT